MSSALSSHPHLSDTGSRSTGSYRGSALYGFKLYSLQPQPVLHRETVRMER